MDHRIENDSMGEIEVEASKLWGAQTERSRQNFKIGTEKIPTDLVHNLARIKQAAAIVNARLGLLDPAIAEAIGEAAEEVSTGQWDEHFPLSVWQTGSGTQSNMNANEVIAHRARQLAPGLDVHPNDHVNRGQSSNDVFPSALHITFLRLTETTLLPAIDRLAAAFSVLESRYADLIKVGRTHLQDATPLSVGQEFSAYVAMLETNRQMIVQAADYLRPLALGGTAVGTGLNTHVRFGTEVAEELSRLCGTSFTSEENKFRALSSRDAVHFFHGSLDALAANLMKIANDIRLLGSGPRSGIGELELPANEPGSSIMPGKVNPTQSEALTMLAARVMGNQTTVSIAASSGHLQLNVFLPLLADTVIQSIRLLADGCVNFAEKCVDGIVAREAEIKDHLDRSLMLVTALNPHIGYDKAAAIAKLAYTKGLSLKEAGLELSYLTEEEYDAWVRPEDMIHGLE